MRYIIVEFTNGNGLQKRDVFVCDDNFDDMDILLNDGINQEYQYFIEHSGTLNNFKTRENAHRYFAYCHWDWWEIDEQEYYDMIEKGYTIND